MNGDGTAQYNIRILLEFIEAHNDGDLSKVPLPPIQLRDYFGLNFIDPGVTILGELHRLYQIEKLHHENTSPQGAATGLPSSRG
ncbi:MAG: hypothetical protein ABI002_00475 [Saprospiraceae bacterium]